jgi:glycosyltransferase involved in cell wall biosynthesis
MKEIVTRPPIYNTWKKIERFSVPAFIHGYTVNQQISNEFKKMYNVNYEVIRSIPLKKELVIPVKKERYILYQGAVNEGRSFETLIPAMKYINAPLMICGDGNFLEATRLLVKQNGLEEKIFFRGKVVPGELSEITRNAWIGITIFENVGLSNYYSLANRFFDYIHAGIPQLCVDYPVYREINDQYEVAVLVNDLGPENIALQLNTLLEDNLLYDRLQQNCIAAREVFNWQEEEKKLIHFYKNLLG